MFLSCIFHLNHVFNALDINYNACASIDREKLLIPGADHTMSASTDPDRYWRRVNSFVKRVFGL